MTDTTGSGGALEEHPERRLSRAAFLLAAIGSAVGLGNIWRFPFMVGENGGGAFVLVYLVCIAAIGMPILIGMILIGRRGRQSPINSMYSLAQREGRGPAWGYLGWLTVAAAFLALTFFSVIASWALDYTYLSATGAFDGITAEGSNAMFDELKASPLRMSLWQAMFMGLTVLIVARGVKGGLEKAVKFMMPALFVILIILVAYAAATGEFAAAARFMFEPDFSKLTPSVLMQAVGQAFFTLSVGGGGMIAYGAYMRRKDSIVGAVVVIASVDTAVAIFAGFAIFPVVFAAGLEPAAGPGLIFVTLPIAFGAMPAGAFFGALFFLLVVFAALTTSISMLEPTVAWLEENKGLSRPRMALASGALAWAIGLGTVFSFNLLSAFTPLDFLPAFEGMTIFRLIDYLVVIVLLPVSALLLAIFVGWKMSRASTLDELGMKDGFGFRLWRFLVRYVAPVAVIGVFLVNLA